MSISDTQKKRGRPPTGVTPQQGVRLPADVLSALEKWREEHPDQGPTRAGAIIFGLRDWLTGLGYLTDMNCAKGEENV